jgi:hypothetical protein
MHDLFVAVLGGLMAALLSYLFGRILLRPRLRCSNKIRVRVTRQGREIYQFKLQNVSYFRPIYDIRFSAVLKIPVTDEQSIPGRERNLLRIRMKLSATEALRLSESQTRVVAIECADPTEFTLLRLQQLTKDKGIAEELDNLPRLLGLNLYSPEHRKSHPSRHAELLITCNCRDSYTGRDFSFMFQPFTREDCCRGNFRGLDDNEVDRAARRILGPLAGLARHLAMRRQELGFIHEGTSPERKTSGELP